MRAKKDAKKAAKSKAQAAPVPYYIGKDGAKVQVRGVKVGEHIAKRRIADFEDDGRVIFVKEKAAPKPAPAPTKPLGKPAPVPKAKAAAALQGLLDKNVQEGKTAAFSGVAGPVFPKIEADPSRTDGLRDFSLVEGLPKTFPERVAQQVALTAMKKDIEAKLDSIKEEIEMEMDLNDAREIGVGKFKLAIVEVAGRSTIDKTLLLKEGVEPDVIGRATVTGKGSSYVKVTPLEKR